VGRDVATARAFFGPRAATWDGRFPEDAAKFGAAVRDFSPPKGGTVLDAGCGTGRGLAHLRGAVGPGGRVIGIDVTPEMLAVARPKAVESEALLALADVTAVPLRSGSVDAVFAAGLLPHLDDPGAALRELARVTRPGAGLALFHPVGRAPLAARHGHAPSDDAVLAPATLPRLLSAAGWDLEELDDGDGRYLALARRVTAVGG